MKCPPTTEVVTEAADTVALVANAARQGRFSFHEAQVPIGAVLTFARDGKFTATVVDERTIEFEGYPSSLSKAALICLQRSGLNWKTAYGALYWLYEGETLLERRERLSENPGDA